MLIVFFDWIGIIHLEFVPYGQVVNGQFYLNFMKHLTGTAKNQKRPEERKKLDVTLNHDNAPAHLFLYLYIFGEAQVDSIPQAILSPDVTSVISICSKS